MIPPNPSASECAAGTSHPGDYLRVLIHSADLGLRARHAGDSANSHPGRDPRHRQQQTAHPALSLERLEAITGQPLQRIGISATQESVADMARFLLGTRKTPCTTIDLGRDRPLDLGLGLSDSPLEAVMAGMVWGEIYDRLAALARKHRTTLIFVNTRRLAERVAHYLSERLGADAVIAHHGSLAREHRREAETRLKAGSLRALVATASLELGIDIGDIDLVCQLGSPSSLATLVQRVGRSGHALSATPKGRLFPLYPGMIWRNASPCSRQSGNAGSIPSVSPISSWTYWPNRSPPRSPPRGETSRSCSTACAGPSLTASSPARTSTQSCKCSPTASRPGRTPRRLSVPRPGPDQWSAAGAHRERS